MDEREFQSKADRALEDLNRRLIDAGDDYGFEADFHAGALTIEFEQPPARFVVSPNSPVRQIWVSANVTSYKLDWDEEESSFMLPSGQSLVTLIEQAIGRHLGQEVNL